MFNPAVVVALLSVSASAARVRKHISVDEESIALQTEAYNETSDKLIACSSYCVQCANGQTIWYGRSKNWLKLGHTAGGALTGAVVAALMTSVVGIPIGLGVGAAAVGVGATAGGVGTNLAEVPEETHTHWSAHIPTTGMFCERTDIIKFGKDRDATCLMRSRQSDAENPDRTIPSSNALKPYITDTNVVEEGFVEEDLDNYKKGCKIVKGAGTKGWKQVMPGKTDEGVLQCSLHSKLCGAGGAPQILPSAVNANACAALANNVAK